MQIQFLGAADTVTGSKHLVTLGGQRVLLDCGMFQGYKVLRERNWAPLGAAGIAPREIDAVVLSHAHLDHSGWLPALVKAGFRGPVYCTPATRDLAGVMLLDAAHLQEEDARRANRQGFSRHAKALPLYTRRDAMRALDLLRAVAPERDHQIGDVKMRLTPVGHLLGACSVSLAHAGTLLAFSGDVGRDRDLLMPPPQPLPTAWPDGTGRARAPDVLLLESTYGNRRHPNADPAADLARIVRDTAHRGGRVLLPAFAVGRAQALLLLLQRLKRCGEIPERLPLFVDSPMAIEATALYRTHRKLLRVPPREIADLCDGVHLVATPAQSQRLQGSRMPAVVISASGMATGGRVLGHLATLAPDERNAIVLAGFQVGGSRGARLLAGEREIKIHGRMVPVRAPVHALEGLSGHADADELLGWLRHLPEPPGQTFVVHGEAAAADTLRLRLKNELGWNTRVPQQGEVVTL